MYTPKPIETAHNPLPEDLVPLVERLAEHIHDTWAKRRIDEGWTLGPQRDDTKLTHPCLVPFDELPDSEKQYDRDTATQAVRAILALGGKVSLDRPDEALADLNATSDAIAVADIGKAMLDEGLYLQAFDLLRRAQQQHPNDLTLAQLLARTLDRTGATVAARTLLLQQVDAGHRDGETLGLLAAACKRIALETRDTARMIEARQYYQMGFDLALQRGENADAYYPGINAATLAYILGDEAVGLDIAQQVQRICTDLLDEPRDDSLWLTATLGEAALLLGDMQGAETHYKDAFSLAGGRAGSVTSMRRQLRWLIAERGLDPLIADRWLPAKPIVAFAGHMIDTEDRAEPRFPAAEEVSIAHRIRDHLRAINPTAGYASAACGSDILFHEALRELNIESHVVLPFPAEVFRETSVGKNWAARFDAVLEAAAEVQVISTHVPYDQSLGYTYANHVLLGAAVLRAEGLATRVQPLVVWDGKFTAKQGGTDEFIRLCERRGLPVEPICIGCDRGDCETYAKDVAEAQGIAAILFADVAGFSKLNEKQASQFVDRYMTRIAEVIDGDAVRPEVCNTWGDGLILVYKDVAAAGRVALALSEAMATFDLAGAGLPTSLSLRTALHAGPVMAVIDPVTKRPTVAGSHVSQAARIEPITPKGQVYASQAFAALAEAQGEDSLKFVYVGFTSLAKGFGRFPLYHVRGG